MYLQQVKILMLDALIQDQNQQKHNDGSVMAYTLSQVEVLDPLSEGR